MITEKIYFCQVGRHGPIKIGISLFPATRISGIRSCNPYPIRCLGVIEDQTKDDEKEILQRFHESRIRGEWFRPTPELLDFITEHASNNPRWGAINAWQETTHA